MATMVTFILVLSRDFYFKFSRRGALATTIGMAKPHMDDYTEIHQNSYTFTQKLATSSSLMNFRDISSYSIHKSHGILMGYSIICFLHESPLHWCTPKLALEPCDREMHHFCHGVDPDSAFVRSILGMGEGSQLMMESSFDV